MTTATATATTTATVMPSNHTHGNTSTANTANPYSMMHRTLQNKDGATYVTEIEVNDVLLGRGTGPNDHPGNVVFRNLIKDQFNSYGTASVRGDKTKMARQAVAFIHNRHGRFLRRLDPHEVSTLVVPQQDKEVYLVIADDRLLIQKTKQAFRHLLRQTTTQAFASSASASAAAASTNKDTAMASPVSAAKVVTPPRTRSTAISHHQRQQRQGARSISVRSKSPETVSSGESGVRLDSVSLASAAIAASVAAMRARALSSRKNSAASSTATATRMPMDMVVSIENNNHANNVNMTASPTSTASFSAIDREVHLLKLVAENDRQIRSQLVKMQLLNLLSSSSSSLPSSPPRTDQRTSLLAALSSGTAAGPFGHHQHGASLPAFGYGCMGVAVADSRAAAWNRQRLLSELSAAEQTRIRIPSLLFR